MLLENKIETNRTELLNHLARFIATNEELDSSARNKTERRLQTFPLETSEIKYDNHVRLYGDKRVISVDDCFYNIVDGSGKPIFNEWFATLYEIELENVIEAYTFNSNKKTDVDALDKIILYETDEAAKANYEREQSDYNKAKTIEEYFRIMEDNPSRATYNLLDVYNSLGITGKEAETLLDKVHITVNKNTIPNETLSPMKASGLRLGSPAMTTRGLKEEDFIEIADIIYDTLINKDSEEVLEQSKQRVLKLTAKFPLKN